jgi:type I site-specific restriction endonuclease
MAKKNKQVEPEDYFTNQNFIREREQEEQKAAIAKKARLILILRRISWLEENLKKRGENFSVLDPSEYKDNEPKALAHKEALEVILMNSNRQNVIKNRSEEDFRRLNLPRLDTNQEYVLSEDYDIVHKGSSVRFVKKLDSKDLEILRLKGELERLNTSVRYVSSHDTSFSSIVSEPSEEDLREIMKHIDAHCIFYNPKK